MKKVLAVFAFVAMSAMAADWTGYIVDQACATKQGAKAASDDHAACAAKCMKAPGATAVLMTADGKIYKVAEQDKVAAHVGHKVTITGKMTDDTISVDSVKM
jgi:hypothetical protein